MGRSSMSDNTVFIGAAGKKPEVLFLSVANRHGLVTGATGFTPGDTVAYSLTFQVSDFFAFNNV